MRDRLLAQTKHEYSPRQRAALLAAATAAANASYREELLPYLLRHLETCRPKDVPQHAEAILPAVDTAHADAFAAVLERRMVAMMAAQAARLRRVIRQAEGAK